MKVFFLFLTFVFTTFSCLAQDPLPRVEALRQFDRSYDSDKETAQWVCLKEQESDKPHAGWRCPMKDETVSISVELVAEVDEGAQKKTYVVTSAKPANEPLGFECHACQPAIGVAVFAWKSERWILESEEVATGFYGGWGGPPSINLVGVGPEKHGVISSINDQGQGYSSSYVALFIPLGNTVSQVWSIQVEDDNLGAIDPDDKLDKQLPYRSSAAFRFYSDTEEANDPSGYYDIEVVSRGTDREESGHTIKQENWTAIYRFSDGKYRLLRRQDFIEMKKPHKKPRIQQ